jgi:predicted ATP-dependent serine protease
MVPRSVIAITTRQRMFLGIKELDRVIGNGIMPSSLIVLTRDPGISKVTLFLQIFISYQNSTYFIFLPKNHYSRLKGGSAA